MVITIYGSMALIILIYFISIPKYLHIFEIIFISMAVNIANLNYSTIITLNLKLIQLTKSEDKFWAFVLNRNVISPLLVVWLMNYYVSQHSLGKKAIFTFMITTLLVGVEYLGDWLGITKHTQWTIGWVCSGWLLIIFILFLLMAWFRSFFQAGVNVR